jgi:hypothetical protein
VEIFLSASITLPRDCRRATTNILQLFYMTVLHNVKHLAAGCTTILGAAMNTILVRAREISVALLATAVVDLRGPCKPIDALATDSSRQLRPGRNLLRSARDKYAESCRTDRVIRHV